MTHNYNYDFLIVGAGFFGSVCGYELSKLGYKCLLIDKRENIAGNCFTEKVDNIHVHKYGAHIFHTNEDYLWNYVNQFAEFKQYNHNVLANYKNNIYTLPFNMWTFNQLWGVRSPQEAKKILESQKLVGKISNLEQQAISMVGSDIYKKLIKEYTEKQWGKSCEELPPSIIKRLPVRYTWDSNYFNDKYVGIPKGGYTQIFEKMLSKSEVRLKNDYFQDKQYFNSISKSIIFTGPIDQFFDYKFGKLEYRSLKWETEILDSDNFQGVPVMNFTSKEVPYTRIIEHKWFDFNNQKNTIISYEFPQKYDGFNEPYYPIRDDKNTLIFNKYYELSKEIKNIYFGGRLANYVYYDMHQIIASALNLVKEIHRNYE